MDSFRGLAGDVVCSFVQPSTIFKSIPVLIFFAISIGAIAFALEDAFPFDLLLSLMVLSYAVSRFAIPAASGEFDDGWFSHYNSNSTSLGFSLRYVVITLIWTLPSAAILWLISYAGGGSLVFDPSPMSLAQSGLMGLVTLLLGLVFIFAPTLGFIICTATDRIADMFNVALWRSLLIEQKADLVVFYASLIGGVLVFWLIYALPLIIIVMLGMTLSSALGGALGGFIISLPLIMAPVLLGRLCGALVKGAAQQEAPDTTSPPAPLSAEPPSQQPHAKPQSGLPAAQQVETGDETAAPKPRSGQPATPQAKTDQQTSASISGAAISRAASSGAAISGAATSGAVPGQPPQEQGATVDRYAPGAENTLAKMLEKVENITALHIGNAILLARNRCNGRPDDPFAAAETTLLLAKSDDLDEVVASAANSIPLALNHGFNELAIKLYMACGKQRRRLELDKERWVQLSSVLTNGHHYQTAVICLQSGGLASAQKFRSIADLAKKNGKGEQAQKILQMLQKKYPRNLSENSDRGA